VRRICAAVALDFRMDPEAIARMTLSRLFTWTAIIGDLQKERR